MNVITDSKTERPYDGTDPNDDQAIVQLVQSTYDDYKHGRIPFERQWYKSAHFLIGNHWIAWNTLDNQWRKKRLPPYVPTPVTNKYASAGQRLVSVISRIEPNWSFVPASDSTEDIKAAEQCDIAKDIICEENHIESIRQRIAPWVVYNGNCFLLSGVEGEYEEQANEQEKELLMSSPEFLAMPPDMQEAMLAQQFGPRLKNGRLFTDVLSPYEGYLDQTIESFEDQQKFLVVNRRSKEYIKLMWGVDVDDIDADSKLNYLESLGYICPDAYTTGYVHGRQKVRRAVVKRLYMKPSDKYPEGLYAVTCGDKVLEKNSLPKTKEAVPKPFIPVAQIKFDSVMGAAWGRTPMDDVIQKNIQRNKIESLSELIILRMGAPVWLIPQGTTIQGLSGEPGSQLNYSMIGDKAGVPSRIPGEQIPASVIQFIAMIDKDIEDLVSTFEALKGQAPYSGAPNIAIENLIEQGLTRFGPSLRNIGEGYRTWMKHQLEYLRTYGLAERFFAKKGENTKWQVDKFIGANITGAVNVRIESDSTIPRSHQIKVNKVLGAVNAGLLSPQNPNERYNILRELEIQHLADGDGDVTAAIKENELMLSGYPVQVTPFIDNHPIHIFQHKKAWQSTDDPQLKQILAVHVAEHNMNMDAEMNGGQQPGPAPKGNMSQEDQKNMQPGKPETAPLPEGAVA